MSVDKEQLAEVLRFEGQAVEFAHSKKLDDDFKIKKLTIEGLGAVSVPITAQDVKKIRKLAEPVSYECGKEVVSDEADAEGWKIEGTDVTELSPATYLRSELPDVMSEVLSRMQIDADDVEAQLDKLMIYEKGGSFKCTKRPVADAGYFGIMIIQIPVQGGYEGGKLNIEHENIKSSFDHSKGSDQDFFVTVLYADCHHDLEAITKGFHLSLVFDLFWKKTAMKSSENLPATLQTLTEVKEILKPWEDSGSKSELLAIPLEHKYTPKSLSFTRLKGKDRLVAQVLKSVDFLCVHLAILNKTVSGAPNEDLERNQRPSTDESGFLDDDGRDAEGDEVFVDRSDEEEPKEKKTKIKSKMKPVLTPVKVESRSKMGKGKEIRKTKVETNYGQKKNARMVDESPPVYTNESWIDVENRKVNMPGLEIQVPDELVGDENEIFDPESPDKEKCEGANGNDEGGRKLEFWYRRAVMVIWPKRQTFNIACRAGIDPALDELEQTCKANSCSAEEMLTKLKRIIWFCRQNPNKVWRVDRNRCRVRGERACRLLKLCILMNALPEGLDVLKLLGAEFKKDSKSFYGHNESFFYEGLQSEEVASSVADFIQLVGWESTGSLISKLFSFVHCPRLEQIGKFASLAVHLLERDCIDAAIAVCSKTMQLLVKTDLHRLMEVCKNGVSSCAVMAMHLESHAKTSSKLRVNSFIIKVKTLNVKQWIQLMADVQQSTAVNVKHVAGCKQFYLELCKLLAAHITAPGMVTEVMKCYLWLEDPSVAQQLIELICEQSPSTGNNALQTVLSSEQSWNHPKSPTGNHVFENLVKIRVEQLRKLKQPKFNWKQRNAVMKDHPKVEEFLRSADREFVYSNFTGVENARQFVDRYFAASGLRYGYSARAIVGGKGRSAFVEIIKTKDVFEASVREYRQQQEELKKLFAGNRQSSFSQPVAKRLKTEMKETTVTLE